MKSLDQRSHAFVVNVWEERRDIAGAERTWRGSVVDVEDGQRFYFNTLTELCVFLEQRAQIPYSRGRLRDRLLRHLPIR